MRFELSYHPEVKNSDLPKIDRKIRKIIRKAIEEKLATHPEVYGKPLQRSLTGYWKLRVGDYRVVFKITGKTVFILGIIHRKNAYQISTKRNR